MIQHILRGKDRMKILKISKGKGFFHKNPDNWVEIDQITKEDLLSLLDKVISDDLEMDEFQTTSLHNKAHQIIYKNLYQKFNELNENKNRFKDESEQLYKSAIDKYCEALNYEKSKKGD